MGTLNRFAISALSRDKKNNALNEEMMLHKESGQVLIKTPSGDVISFDSLSRQRNHIDTLTLMAFNLNIKGDIFSLELPFELPEIVQENINLIDTAVTLKANNLNKFLVSVDIDSVDLTSSDAIIEYEPYIKLDLSFVYGEESHNVIFNFPASKIGSTVIQLSDYNLPSDIANYSVILNGLYIGRDPNATTIQLKNILYSVLVIVE